VTGGLLSLLWIVLAVQDIRVQKLGNVGTLSAFALALGHRLGSGESWPYLFSLAACIALAFAIYATGMIGGGDAKLLLSVLAWQPAADTWAITLACLALIGGAVVAWSRFRRQNRQENRIRRYPLGGVIAAAGLIVLWIP
jgi:Flp pilus assembly protein protease CpaA